MSTDKSDASGGGGEGYDIGVENLSYTVKVSRQEEVRILDHVTCRLQSGQVTAVMGPGGSGKSTLLEVIANRKRTGTGPALLPFDPSCTSPMNAVLGQIDGNLLVNNVTRMLSPAEVGFATKDQAHLKEFSIYETLYFAARLRMPANAGGACGDTLLQERCLEVANLLQLQYHLNAKLWHSDHRAVSEVQLRCLSIGVEIVHLPQVILLDEITNGLDPFVASTLFSIVKQVARQLNRTLVASVSTPTAEVFLKFDSVVLLGDGGVIYAGRADEIQNYFTSSQYPEYELDARKNIAEFIVEIAGERIPPLGHSDALVPEDLSELFRKTPMFKALSKRMSDPEPRLSEVVSFKTNISILPVLYERTFKRYWRRPMMMATELIKRVLSGLWLGVVYYNQGRSTSGENICTPVNATIDNFTCSPGHIKNTTFNVASFLFYLILWIFASHTVTFSDFYETQELLQQEMTNGLYGARTYLTYLVTNRLPSRTFLTVLYSSIAYWMVFSPNSTTGGQYFYFLLVCITVDFFVQCLSTLVDVIVPSKYVMGCFSAISAIMLSLTGFSIRVPKMSIFFASISKAVPPRWAYLGLLINEFSDALDGTSLVGMFDDSSQTSKWWQLFYCWVGIAGMITLSWFALALPQFDELVVRNVAPPIATSTSDDERDGDLSAPLVEDSQRGSSVGQAGGRLLRRISSRVPGSATPTNFLRRNSSNIVRSRGCTLAYDISSFHFGDEDEPVCTNFRGVVKPGDSLLITGISNTVESSESTLLNLLAARPIANGVLHGRIKYNGQDWNPTMRRVCAFVEQDDRIIDGLSVRETLEFAAKLRLNEKHTKEQRTAQVEQVAAIVKLKDLMDVVVGGRSSKRLANGDRRRLHIGCEIIHLPPLIFLDDPTKNLDFFRAEGIVNTLLDLAREKRTIVCHLPKPSPSIFKLFSKVHLLSYGNSVYFGPTNRAADFFKERAGFRQEYQSPADFVLHVASCDGQLLRENGSRNDDPVILAELYDQSAYGQELKNLYERELGANAGFDSWTVNSQKAFSEFPTSFSRQYYVLMHRSFLRLARKRSILKQCLAAGLMGIFYSLVYQPLFGTNDDDDFQRTSILFFSILQLSMRWVVELPAMTDEHELFRRERGVSAYRTTTHFFVCGSVNFCTSVAYCLVYCAVLALFGFADSDIKAFFINLLVLFLVDLMSFAYTQFLVHLELGLNGSLGVFIYPILFWGAPAGYFVATTSATLKGWKWFVDLDPFKWAFEDAFLSNSLYSGMEKSYGFSNSHQWTGVLVLVAYILLFSFGSLICLMRNSWIMVPIPSELAPMMDVDYRVSSVRRDVP